MPSHLVVALDPVNFEKPYTSELEDVCTVMKSTPPGERGAKRLTSGYPAITATVVNLQEPVITYANWFSYQSQDFVSENQEIYQAIRTTRALFPLAKLRFVGDAGLDDQVKGGFIIRACHNRNVEVYNDRLDRWEEESLNDLVATVPLPMTLQVSFTRARKVRVVEMALGWFKMRIPRHNKCCGFWLLTILTMIAIWFYSRTSRSSQHDTPKRCIPNGAIAHKLSTHIALTRKMDWMLRMYACKPWNACAASLPWY